MLSAILSLLISLVVPAVAWQSSAQLLFRHPEADRVEVSPYSAAARKAGFPQWAEAEGPGRAQAALRLYPEKVNLGIRVDSSLGPKRIESWAERTAVDLSWRAVDLKVVPQGKSTYVAISAETVVAPALPGQYRAGLSLGVLQRSLARLLDSPVPLAVLVPGQPHAEASHPPLARHREGSDHYSFYLLQPGDDRWLTVEYGLSDGALRHFGLSVLLWLAIPFLAALLARAAAGRAGTAAERTARFARLAWFLSLIAVAIALALTLPAVGDTARALLPASLKRSLPSLAAVPALLCVYLTAVAVELFGGSSRPTGPAEPWWQALSRPLLFAGAALGLAAGLAAALLTWSRSPWLGPAVAMLPFGLALLNYVWARAERERQGEAALPEAEDRSAGAAVPGDKPRGPAQRLLWAAGVMAVVALALWKGADYFSQSAGAPDLGWQIAVGRQMVEEAGPPPGDAFSWTSGGQPWFVQAWLPNAFFYLATTRLPDWTMIAYRAVLGAAAVLLLLGHAYRRSGSLWAALAVAALFAETLDRFIDVRPVMCSFVLTGALLWSLTAYRQGGARWLPWALPAGALLWTNLHGAVALGLLVLVLWLIGEVAARLLLREETPPLRPMVLGTAAAFIAACFSYNGLRVLTATFEIYSLHPGAMDEIKEWLSPNFHHNEWLAFELLLLGALGGFAFLRRRALSDLLILLFLAHSALTSVRAIPFFCLAAGPIAAEAAVTLVDRWPAFLSPLRIPAAARAVAASLVVAGLLGLAWKARPTGPPDTWFERGIALSEMPVEAAERLARGEWPGRLFNEYGTGGFLTWQLYPQRKVFVDGRAEPYYQTGAFDDSLVIARAKPGWSRLLEKWGVETILTSKQSGLAAALKEKPDHGYEKVFEGKVEEVWIRKQQPRRESPAGAVSSGAERP
ncbi:MAG: hypothetical protein ACK47B_24650 [Armatimonadota bacterium]